MGSYFSQIPSPDEVHQASEHTKVMLFTQDPLQTKPTSKSNIVSIYDSDYDSYFKGYDPIFDDLEIIGCNPYDMLGKMPSTLKFLSIKISNEFFPLHQLLSKVPNLKELKLFIFYDYSNTTTIIIPSQITKLYIWHVCNVQFNEALEELKWQSYENITDQHFNQIMPNLHTLEIDHFEGSFPFDKMPALKTLIVRHDVNLSNAPSHVQIIRQ